MELPDNNSKNSLRTIKTVRNIEDINKAVSNGFLPLLKKVIKSDKIYTKYAIFQHKSTKKIEVVGDFRSLYRRLNEDEYEKLIDWTFYYPHNFESPYAAYLIPKDIKKGERVYVEELIEDFIGSTWNQGDTYRLESCEAIWNGTDLEIQYDPDVNCISWIG